MSTLVIARHAKSDWDHPDLSDHDRPLNARGLRDAPMMADRLAAKDWRPEALLSSTASRARTTAQYYAMALDVDVKDVADLYGASAETLLRVAAETQLANVMIVAHDPGLTTLAHHFAPELYAMPTCGIATFTWKGDAPLADVVNTRPDFWSFDAPKQG